MKNKRQEREDELYRKYKITTNLPEDDLQVYQERGVCLISVPFLHQEGIDTKGITGQTSPYHKKIKFKPHPQYKKLKGVELILDPNEIYFY